MVWKIANMPPQRTLSCEGLCRNRDLSLRPTERSAAIQFFSIAYQIASVVSLLRNDIMTQSLEREGGG
jgi:hypothetical protein